MYRRPLREVAGEERAFTQREANMSDNVRYLPGAEPDEALASAAEANQDVIDALEGLLEAAKAGVIDTLACAYTAGGRPGNVWTQANGHAIALTASIALLHYEYMKSWERIEGDD
jgi:hypothetical protein